MTAKDLARPIGIPLVLADHEPKRNPQLFSFTKQIIGKRPVQFNELEETMIIADTSFTAQEWISFRNRIDLTFAHIGAVKKAPEPSRSQAANNFLTANLSFINKQEEGMLKRPPWFLRPFYSAVAGKEILNGD